jgi:hypothetical protein
MSAVTMLLNGYAICSNSSNVSVVVRMDGDQAAV